MRPMIRYVLAHKKHIKDIKMNQVRMSETVRTYRSLSKCQLHIQLDVYNRCHDSSIQYIRLPGEQLCFCLRLISDRHFLRATKQRHFCPLLFLRFPPPSRINAAALN